MASITATITTTVTATITTAISSASPSATVRAAPQGGVLEGLNPTVYSSSNPIVLFIIQAGIIIIFCRLLHYPLQWLGQPKVISEVLGGIILGPSVMMRIPGFKATIFPTAAMAGLNLVANIGLILFLFLVALEVDLRLFMKNWRVALSVGLAGMILPFGLGCGLAYGLYYQFRSDPGIKPVSLGVYMLFIGTALSITAFPVLCRILTELKLLGSAVGVTVLAAGVGNDVVGWILLALCVALVNNGSGLAALWVLLTCVGYVLVLFFAVRPCFMWALRKSGSLHNGPTQSMVGLTILLVLTSAFFTNIIGVHAIFGAFLVGLICPHEGGFSIKLTEKIEDLVSVLFLPLYFTLSGLSTDLGLLNDGITWGYVVGVIAVAFAGKIIGGTLAARSCKLVWRESLTIGCLMSCKGLVELIVLNIGLQANILSKRTFTMFVIMALVTTVATTPLTKALYPPWYQKKLESWKRGEIDWDGNRLHQDEDRDSFDKVKNNPVRKLLVYLRLDSLPSLFTFVSLLQGDSESKERPLEVHGSRILELTERTSSVMKSSEADEYTFYDPVVNAFRTFGQLNHVAVSGDVTVVPESSYAETIIGKASDMSSDLVLIPWTESGAMSEGDQSYFSIDKMSQDRFSSGSQMSFVEEVLDSAKSNTAIFINRGFVGTPPREPPTLQRTHTGLSLKHDVVVSPATDLNRHIHFPFFGGDDDRVALRLVLQLAINSNVTATIIHVKGSNVSKNSKAPEVVNTTADAFSNGESSTGNVEETPGSTAAQDTTFLHSLRDSLPQNLSSRVSFLENNSTSSISTWLTTNTTSRTTSIGDLVVLGRRRGVAHVTTEPEGLRSGIEVRNTLGAAAECMLGAGVKASILVVQAASTTAARSEIFH